ncbi:hypothetical protein AB1N83_013766, partial [Pleurotus pulmonarius]
APSWALYPGFWYSARLASGIPNLVDSILKYQVRGHRIDVLGS